MQVSNNAILGSMKVVSFEFLSYGASTASENGDPGINLEDDHKKVVKLGTKSSIDIKHLNVFKNARKWLHSRAMETGTRFLDGYLMTPENAATFVAEVKALYATLQVKVESLIDNFDTLVDEWANKNPAYSVAIRTSAPSKSTVRSRFKFKVRSFYVSGSGDETDSDLDEDVGGIVGGILSEIAKDVRTTWTKQDHGPKKIRTLLKKIATKADSLSLINTDLLKISNLVNETLLSIPDSGKDITDTQYLQLNGLFDMLSHPRDMLDKIKNKQLAIVIQDTSDDATQVADAATATATQVVEADATTATATQVVEADAATADAAFDSDHPEVLVEQAKSDESDVTAAPVVTPVTTPLELNSSWNW